MEIKKPIRPKPQKKPIPDKQSVKALIENASDKERILSLENRVTALEGELAWMKHILFESMPPSIQMYDD